MESGSTITKETTNSTQAGGDWSFGVGLAWSAESEVPITGIKLNQTEGQIMATTYGFRYLGNEKTSAKATTTTQNLTIPLQMLLKKGISLLPILKTLRLVVPIM